MLFVSIIVKLVFKVEKDEKINGVAKSFTFFHTQPNENIHTSRFYDKKETKDKVFRHLGMILIAFRE